jgi:molybdopterin-guanine dinucleotide biosynthesis protein A
MNIGGIVLCGGASRRMGKAKDRLEIGDETMLGRTVRVVGEVAKPVVVAAREGQELASLPTGIEVVRDNFVSVGPVAGIEAGLRGLQGRCDAAIVTACDHPELSSAVLRALAREFSGKAMSVLIVEHEGRWCPLLGVYGTELAEAARGFLLRGGRAAARFAEECHAVVISSEAFREVDPSLRSFVNVNDPPAYDSYRRRTETPSDE